MKRQANGHTTTLATRPAKTSAGNGELVAELRRLEGLFENLDWPDRRAYVRARKGVRERVLEFLDAGPPDEDTHAVLRVAAAELFRALTAARAADAHDAAELARRIEDLTGLSRMMLAREVLRAPELLAAPPELAIETLLVTLVACAPLRSASVWTHDTAERASCLCHAGEGAPSRGVRQLAQRLLAGQNGEPDDARRGLLLGLPLGRWERPRAALVGSARPWMRETCQVFLEEAVPMLGALLEREMLRAESVASQRALVESSERKLTRLGFDLHDGPIQDVAVLAEDLRMFRDQLAVIVGSRSDQRLVRGRIEDLDAQVAAIDAELRRLSSEVQAASVLLQRPFRAALRERIQAFTARTGIRPRLTLLGELKLSTSQQIALLNIIGEALSNIREHANATKVEISVSANDAGVQAKVADDGRGFDLEATLMRAAREGRIGLLAMNERVRLLGGQCRIDSRPGGPTTVSVALERWQPVLEEPPSRPADRPSPPSRRTHKAAPTRARG
jgi:signal transduction histidine kinase